MALLVAANFSLGLHCNAPCPDMRIDLAGEGAATDATGAQLVILAGDVTGGLDATVTTTEAVHVTLVRGRDLQRTQDLQQAVGALARAVLEGPGAEEPPERGASRFERLSEGPVEGAVDVRLAAGELPQGGFDTLLLVPLSERPFDVTVTFRQTRVREVFRGHHGQCDVFDPSANPLANDRPLGTIVAVEDAGAM